MRASRWVPTVVLALGVTLVGGLAYAGDDPPVRASAVASDLFVRTAGGGTLQRIPGRKRTYRLTLKSLGGPVTVFTDRPQRKTGAESTTQFVRRWRSRGFSASPPNAALVLAHGRRRQDVKVFELSRPRLRRGALSFTARDLGRKSTNALAGFGKRADKTVPRRFGRASLFIDPSGSDSEQQVEFRFTYTGSGADDTTVGLDDQKLNATDVGSMDGNVRFHTDRNAGFIVGCERRTDGPCSVTVTLTVSPSRTPVTGGAHVGSSSTLTARVLPNGASTPIQDDIDFSLRP